jgi:hypothetical protein
MPARMGRVSRRHAIAILSSLFVPVARVAAGTTDAKPGFLWGANGHPFVSYPGVTFEQQLDFLADLGMRSYRVDVTSLDHANALARLVELARPRGIDILPILIPPNNLEDPADKLYAQSREFARLFVGRFKSIRVWELNNELENYAIIKACEMQDDGVQYNCAWGPADGGGPLHYYGPRWKKVSAVLKGLSDGTAAVDPQIRKAIGTAGWGHWGAFERMQEDGIQWDISVWHHYEGDPAGGLKHVVKFGRPIWITEFNNPLGSKNGEQIQADGLDTMMRRILDVASTYKVEAAHVYELLDESYWQGSEAVMGLVRLEKDDRGKWRPGGPKLAYQVARKIIRGEQVSNSESGRK